MTPLSPFFILLISVIIGYYVLHTTWCMDRFDYCHQQASLVNGTCGVYSIDRWQPSITDSIIDFAYSWVKCDGVLE